MRRNAGGVSWTSLATSNRYIWTPIVVYFVPFESNSKSFIRLEIQHSGLENDYFLDFNPKNAAG
jgi:hypothetical protein